jgi:SAM-dependent methyltransferase
MDSVQLENLLIFSINQRYEAHASKDLNDYVYANHLFHSVNPSFIDFAFKFRRNIADYLSNQHHLKSLIDYCVRSTKYYTYKRNQFINFPSPYNKLLNSEYHDFFQQIKRVLIASDSSETLTNSFSTILRRHHERLRLILSSYCLSNPNNLPENRLLTTVPCDEYSAPFQLRLLNIDLGQLKEPILDIGCGTSGTLVKFLRNEGYAAFGIDRLAPATPYFFQIDWFEFDYADDAWGTIIAHQSLSTNFIYNHLHSPANAMPYANLFMKIITSLRPGGEFYYAPGLRFFEDQLRKDKNYTIDTTVISLSNQLKIDEISYVTKIKR